MYLCQLESVHDRDTLPRTFRLPKTLLPIYIANIIANFITIIWSKAPKSQQTILHLTPTGALEMLQVRLHLNVKLFNGIRMTGFVIVIIIMDFIFTSDRISRANIVH